MIGLMAFLISEKPMIQGNIGKLKDDNVVADW